MKLDQNEIMYFEGVPQLHLYMRREPNGVFLCGKAFVQKQLRHSRNEKMQVWLHCDTTLMFLTKERTQKNFQKRLWEKETHSKFFEGEPLGDKSVDWDNAGGDWLNYNSLVSRQNRTFEFQITLEE